MSTLRGRNRESGGATTSSVFNDANQLTSRGTTSYGYDAAGNLLSSSAGAAYSYNSLNQSTSIKRAGGSAQSQVYAGASQFERIEKQNGTGTYTQFGESILGMLIRKQGTGTYYTRLPDGSLLSQRTPAGTHYYLEDGLGSITGMTDANGALVAEYRYDPYGWVIYEKSGSPYNPWRFKSGYQSQTTLHYKFGHRWYDPQTGRWTQADPLEQPTKPRDWNRYTYAGSDPENVDDLLGLAGSPALGCLNQSFRSRNKRLCDGGGVSCNEANVVALILGGISLSLTPFSGGSSLAVGAFALGWGAGTTARCWS